MTRRKFLSWLSVGLGGLAAAVVSIPVIGAILQPLLAKHTPIWRSVGSLQDFAIGDTVLVKFINANPGSFGGDSEKSAAWLRRLSADTFLAFSVNCTHLGCPIRWEAGSELFMCPCHGGVYYKDGTVAAGPPPRALQQYPVRLRGTRVEVKAEPIPLTPMTA